MKKIFGSFILIVSALTGFTTPAHATDCSATDPCQTWAVVDSTGLVTNIIVCQPSVCGSGTFGGQKVVLQVPANPTTNQSQGGYYGGPDPQSPTAVHYDSVSEKFTQGSSTAPILVTRTEVVDTVTVTATVNSEQVTFGLDSFVDNQMQFTPVVTSTTGANISATQGTTNETQSFISPQTKEQVTAAVVDKPFITKYLSKVFILLRGWILD